MLVLFIHLLGIPSKWRKSVVHGLVVVAVRSCVRVKGFKGMVFSRLPYKFENMEWRCNSEYPNFGGHMTTDFSATRRVASFRVSFDG